MYNFKQDIIFSSSIDTLYKGSIWTDDLLLWHDRESVSLRSIFSPYFLHWNPCSITSITPLQALRDSSALSFWYIHLAKPQAVTNPTLRFWGDHIWVAESCYSYIPGRTVSLINHWSPTSNRPILAQLFYLTSIITFIFNYFSHLVCSSQTSTLQFPVSQ